MAEKETLQVNRESLKQNQTADDNQTSKASVEDSKIKHAEENDQTLGEKSGDAGQNHTANGEHKITYVHELIEIFVGSIALIAPVIIFLLWVNRFAVCKFYNLPIFYSSLNIIRFLPVFLISFGIGVYYWFSDFFEHSNLYSVTINNTLGKKKKIHNSVKERKVLNVVVNFLKGIRFLIIFLFPIVLLGEIGIIISGEYPLFSIYGEASVILGYAGASILVFIITLYNMITNSKELDKYSKEMAFYVSKKWKNFIIRVSFLDTSIITGKHIIGFFLIYFLFGLVSMAGYIAIFQSFFKSSYYLVDFDNTKYAIVLDTDDYYIGEPIGIIRHENERELVIFTDAYIYLDKAENPILVQKETFDAITILREE